MYGGSSHSMWIKNKGGGVKKGEKDVRDEVHDMSKIATNKPKLTKKTGQK